MAKTVNEYVKEITKTLKANKTYSRGLDMQILSLASAMRNLEMANNQIDGLTETTVWETTRYGEKLAPHPVFKIAKESVRFDSGRAGRQHRGRPAGRPYQETDEEKKAADYH